MTKIKMKGVFIMKGKEKIKKFNVKEIMKYFEGLVNTHIIYFAKMKNGDFLDYEYFTIERKNYIFYIKKNDFSSWTFAPVTITAYKKIDYWKKVQCDYPIGAYNMQDILNYINKNIKEQSEALKDCYGQRNLDFERYKKQNEKDYKNIFERLNLGYREKEILNNIERVEMIQNDGDYLVYKIVDNKSNYFLVELKSERIVG